MNKSNKMVICFAVAGVLYFMMGVIIGHVMGSIVTKNHYEDVIVRLEKQVKMSIAR